MLGKKFFLSAIGCSIIHFSGWTQDARMPKIIPPAPDAAAFQKFGDIPISAYSGTPTISIPLYEIKSGDISVPVSINYNATGIKVADEAGRVGLGWSLNAGGAISRSIIGKDDWDDYLSQTFGDIPLGQKFDQGANFNYKFNCLQSINGYSLPEVLLNDQLSDFQPDNYSYNFNGHSGKFILRRNKDVVLNKIEKIDIKLSDPTNGTSWEIKTPDGFLYRFEDIETYIDNTTSRKSSWYLSKIISPTGRIVQFLYTSIVQNIQQAGSYFESKPIGFLSSSSCMPSLPSYYSNTVAGRTYHSLYLSKITFDQGEVQFNYSAGRVDIANDVQLNSVKIFSKKYGESVNTLLKTWNLNYSYFEGTSINGWSSPTYPDLLNKRLKLLSIQESTPVETLPSYIFSYNNDNETNVGLLPSKLSFARDHWGYFNGKFGNTSLIPTFYGGGGGVVNLGVMSNERNPDPNYSKLFILNKIQYPTGGSTVFEYESHDFDQTNSIINDHSFYATYTGAVPAVVQSEFSNIQAGGTFAGSLDITNMYPAGQSVVIEASFIKTSGLDISTINQIAYSLKDPVGTEIGGGNVGSYLGFTTPPKTEYLGIQQNNSGVKMTLNKLLTPGVYNWSFTVPAGLTAANATISYTKAESADPIVNSGETVDNALFGGGLRIRRITDYTNASTPAKVKKYLYHYQSNGKIYSYGRRMAKPNYSYYELIPNANCSQACLIRESDSNIPLNGGTNGITVGYDKVEELFGENGENGKNVYEYRNQPDIILDYRVTIGDPLATIPLKPPYGGIISDAGNGNLLTQITYTNINNQFVKNTEAINTYQDLSDLYQSVVYGIDKRVVANQGVFGMNCGILSFYIYPSLTTNRPVLMNSISKLYNPSGATAPITTTTEYTYNNSTHLQLTSKSDYKSNGDKITTSFKYPADYPDVQCDPALLLMKGTVYMHALPVVKQVTLTKGIDQYLANASINKYQVINNKIFSKEIAVLENTQPINIKTAPPAYNPATNLYPVGFVPRLFYDNYDAAGNILQVHKSDDGPLTYIWDYYSNYPVAEITNAEASNCAFTSFEADGKGNWQFTGSAQNDPLSFTGKKVYSLSSGNISASGLNATKNYIVSYWSKTGAVTVNGASALTGANQLGWTYYEHLLATGTTSITISGSSTIDELRLFPKGSLMTTYTYLPLIGISSQTDANGRTTYYEYDAFNRLVLLRDKDNNILKKICYNYAGQVENCSSGCTNTTANWQNTVTALRCQVSGGVNTGYQEQEQRDMNTCSPTYNQTQWVTAGYNTTSCPTPPPCSFSAASGFSIAAGSITNNGSTASFYIAFYRNTTMTAGNSYTVATISTGCRPSATRTLTYSGSGRTWTITIYPSGQMDWYLNPGSASVNAYSTVGTGTLSYNL